MGEAVRNNRGKAPQDIKKQVRALYQMLSRVYGSDKLIIKAGKLEALPLLRSRDVSRRVLGLQRLIYEDPTLEEELSSEELPAALEALEEHLSDLFARRMVEEAIEKKITLRMQEKQDEYFTDIKKQILKEQSGPENPQTLKKFALIEKMRARRLGNSAMRELRPKSLKDIVGQERGVRALMSKLASPYPQHIIIYGPPGVGKTTAARLALEAARKLPFTPFTKESPFVEVDGTSLRWDPREATNPLIGSVHDPIYQGARRDLVDGGVPEPKPGLVTDAHGGVLFIDEIGEMDLHLQSKLLKVLEDKQVEFDSAYYDPTDPMVPKYIHELFEKGAPADFILIGATTKTQEDISPALRSRCSAVFFDPLSPWDIEEIVVKAAARLEITLEAGIPRLISRYTDEGRQAVNLLADAYGLFLYQNGDKTGGLLSLNLVQEVIQNSRLVPVRTFTREQSPRIGKILGLGVFGYQGSILEIEAVAFPAASPGRGSIRFNDTAGSMAKDSVYNAASVIRAITGKELCDYDLHINVIGGGNIDGPSAGAAITLAVFSALEKKPLRQGAAVTGEISLQGWVKPVGGISQKIYAAAYSGLERVFIPRENVNEFAAVPEGLEIIPVGHIREIMDLLICDEEAS